MKLKLFEIRVRMTFDGKERVCHFKCFEIIDKHKNPIKDERDKLVPLKVNRIYVDPEFNYMKSEARKDKYRTKQLSLKRAAELCKLLRNNSYSIDTSWTATYKIDRFPKCTKWFIFIIFHRFGGLTGRTRCKKYYEDLVEAILDDDPDEWWKKEVNLKIISQNHLCQICRKNKGGK